MSQKYSNFDMIFTIKDNIKCLVETVENKFKIRNNKIYFENNHINKKLDTNKIAIRKGKFIISTDNESLIFGIDDSDENISITGHFFVKTKIMKDKNIKFYKDTIDIEVKNNIKDNKLYVLDLTEQIYEIPLIYNETCNKNLCISSKHQSYGINNFGDEINITRLSNYVNQVNCSKSNVYRHRKLIYQQNLYTMMRLYPHKFPITSKAKLLYNNKTHQRIYSNMWWRQFGTSQGLPVNDNFGGFNLVGSDVRYTN